MLLYHKDDLAVQVENGVRRLWLGDVCQGQCSNTKFYEPVSLYAKEIMAKVGKPRTALVIGLGAGILPHALHKKGVDVTVIEPREDIIDVSRRFFKLPKAVKVVIGLAQDKVKDMGRFDLIINDAHDGVEQPKELYCDGFLLELINHLSEDGVVLTNLIQDGKNNILEHRPTKHQAQVYS